ncbi:MAG: ATP-binding protein [Syntrophales bacterium]|nr:ATP-binding protein [Syntrophales bacterium]
MIERPFWIQRIEEAWRAAPIVWLAGVRRIGKTTLVKSLGEDRILYLNCDLPVVEEMVAQPEMFFRNCDRPVVVFDEVHQLRDPSRILKIGADQFPHLKIVATGSSTLAATKKFQDTLTGRKRNVRLTPVLWDEIPAFGNAAIEKRLYHGGLPQALLATTKDPEFYREWMDSFFVRDIQKLFAFRNPDKFTALFEYILKQSGGLLETARTARALGTSRVTVDAYLQALEATHAVTIVRPFFGGGQKEIVKMPKIYAFDTGFVSFSRGWDPLRPDDCGLLWEHVVLEYLQAYAPAHEINYWRDASGREVDFVVRKNRDEVDAVECKWDPRRFEADALKAFRIRYPGGRNYLVCPDAGPGYEKHCDGVDIVVVNPRQWLGKYTEPTR